MPQAYDNAPLTPGFNAVMQGMQVAQRSQEMALRAKQQMIQNELMRQRMQIQRDDMAERMQMFRDNIAFRQHSFKEGLAFDRESLKQRGETSRLDREQRASEAEARAFYNQEMLDQRRDEFEQEKTEFQWKKELAEDEREQDRAFFDAMISSGDAQTSDPDAPGYVDPLMLMGPPTEYAQSTNIAGAYFPSPEAQQISENYRARKRAVEMAAGKMGAENYAKARAALAVEGADVAAQVGQLNFMAQMEQDMAHNALIAGEMQADPATGQAASSLSTDNVRLAQAEAIQKRVATFVQAGVPMGSDELRLARKSWADLKAQAKVEFKAEEKRQRKIDLWTQRLKGSEQQYAEMYRNDPMMEDRVQDLVADLQHLTGDPETIYEILDTMHQPLGSMTRNDIFRAAELFAEYPGMEDFGEVFLRRAANLPPSTSVDPKKPVSDPSNPDLMDVEDARAEGLPADVTAQRTQRAQRAAVRELTEGVRPAYDDPQLEKARSSSAHWDRVVSRMEKAPRFDSALRVLGYDNPNNPEESIAKGPASFISAFGWLQQHREQFPTDSAEWKQATKLLDRMEWYMSRNHDAYKGVSRGDVRKLRAAISAARGLGRQPARHGYEGLKSPFAGMPQEPWELWYDSFDEFAKQYASEYAEENEE